ncbi:MAG: FAD-dependent oxidoreductase [Solirubrobacterales bacterium]
MSVAELTTRARPVSEQRSLWGWGATARSNSTVIAPRDVEDVVERLSGTAGSVHPVIARGAGRSYGDAAQLDGGDVLDMTGWKEILSIDRDRAAITAQAGATIAQLMAALAASGLTLPVVPGTRHVTLGGAIASDIHGKNHHRDGGLASHVLALSLCTPADGCRELSPETDPELFYATLGGMGLTGVVVQATLRAEPLSSPWVAADTDRTDDLEQTLALMAEDDRHRYSVAWLDLLAGGSTFGRAVVSRADDLPAASAPRAAGGLRWPILDRSRVAYPDALLRGPAMVVPRRFPDALLRAAWVRAFNALRLRAAPRLERGRPQPRAQYFFPLDVLGEWNRLYGRAGLIQYQLVIPLGREAALARCFELIRTRRLPVYLAVFKRFGAAFGGPLSFPLAGWTLAIDLPASAPGLRAALDELDEVVAGCGGRVYLSKDARLRRDVLAAMYPQLDRFNALQSRVDPGGVLRSDLSLRLGLCPAPR